MTITDSDLRQYDTTTEEFRPQPTPDECLPICLMNVLDEIAARHDTPDLAVTESELKDVCDYRPGIGSSAVNVAQILGAEIEDIGFTVKTQINTTLSELEEIIDKGTCSYPLVELDPDYFECIEQWNPQPSRVGRSFPHIVVPFTINSEQILYYDPFGAIMVRSGAVSSPKKRLEQSLFFELWSGDAHPRWTMWVEQLEQQTLNAAISRQR